ncbi:hypothetical protein HHX38_29875, partial [Streptomyces sp. PKU-MA01144]|nr:hypothetical protein [Streptomyces sp. PKU-MA01144]
MAAQQLPDRVGDFARYLGTVTERLDPESGWCAVFWRRDPDGLTACLRGTEVPPWDVVESLLQDLAADDAETAHARRLHAAAAAAHDRRPGGAEALRERLDLMRREQARVAVRGRELMRRLAAVPEHSAAYRDLAHDLSWTNDDHTRATSRCAELATRIAALASPPGPPSGPAPHDRDPHQAHRTSAAGAFGAHASAPDRGHGAHRGAASGAADGEPVAWAGRGHRPAPVDAEVPAEAPEAGADSADGGWRAPAAAGGGAAARGASDHAAGPERGGADAGFGGAGAWFRPTADAEAADGGRRRP